MNTAASLQLWLIRHAPVIAPAGLCYGASDYPAEAEATQAAAQQAARLLPQGCQLYSSPLQRCTALAQALLALRPDLQPLHLEPRLAEMNFGQWEGVAWDAIPRAAFDAWMADFGPHRFGGAESTQDFIARVADFMQAQKKAMNGLKTKQIACICHAGTIRALHWLQGQRLSAIQPILRADSWPQIEVPLGSCSQLVF